MSDEDNPIAAYTTLAGIHRTMKVAGSGTCGGPHGDRMTVIVEGHDISHMVRSVDIHSDVSDAVSVTLELVNLTLVNE